MPTESYGEFGLNGIGAGAGDDVLIPSCGPLAWVTASRRSLRLLNELYLAL
jgi:hypothetical protein